MKFIIKFYDMKIDFEFTNIKVLNFPTDDMNERGRKLNGIEYFPVQSAIEVICIVLGRCHC